jgi:hypothetical protein
MRGKSYIVVLKNLKIDESTAKFLYLNKSSIYLLYLQVLIMTTVQWTVLFALEINKNNKHTLTIYRVF